MMIVSGPVFGAESPGEDQGTIDTIVGNYQARFPGPVEDEPAASGRPGSAGATSAVPSGASHGETGVSM